MTKSLNSRNTVDRENLQIWFDVTVSVSIAGNDLAATLRGETDPSHNTSTFLTLQPTCPLDEETIVEGTRRERRLGPISSMAKGPQRDRGCWHLLQRETVIWLMAL